MRSNGGFGNATSDAPAFMEWVSDAVRTRCVYVDPDAGPDAEEVLRDIEREALPFRVIVVREEPPRMTGSRG